MVEREREREKLKGRKKNSKSNIMPCLITQRSDPNSKNGLMTKVWGPAGWLFLHCVTFGYPENPDTYDQEYGFPPGTTRNRYRRFFIEVGNVLPCRY